jgi:acetoin utilization deacetylase AcuC-like enzyme
MAKLEEHELIDSIVAPPEPAQDKIISKIHEESYIGMIKSFGEGYLDPDTYHREETYEIAALAVQGGIMAADYSYENRKPAMALVRPPGHHAGRGYSGGFCYFNNIAVAAQNILDTKDASKVAVIDYDVHHGNGTEDIFYSHKDVLYISTHQWGIYPGTGSAESIGEDNGKGYTVNIPFPHGTGDSSYELAFTKIIKPVLSRYEPDMILISLGTDGHYQDPIATLTLSSNAYLWLAEQTIKLSKELCQGRITFMLEGGYDLEALAEVVTGIAAMIKDPSKKIPMQYTHISDHDNIGFDTVANVKQSHSEQWKLV